MQQPIAKQIDTIHFYELHAQKDTMSAEVHAGLSLPQKALPPKYFYDSKGSELFDAITKLPEYYLTRTELLLLRTHIKEIAELLGRGGTLIELGSGSSEKIRLLLDEACPDRYAPMDISRQHLIRSTRRLADDFPWLEIHAFCADYTRFCNFPDFGWCRYNAFFPGSSIGNFNPVQATSFLCQVHRLVRAGGGLLIGVDLKKDRVTLERAYNDSQKITAEFNLNVLSHINRNLDANFNPEKFSHKANYNADNGRIEMHLHCLEDHSVTIEGKNYRFMSGETIHTENSYKYSTDEFHGLATQAGFHPVKTWVDENSLFSIHYLLAR